MCPPAVHNKCKASAKLEVIVFEWVAAPRRGESGRMFRERRGVGRQFLPLTITSELSRDCQGAAMARPATHGDERPWERRCPDRLRTARTSIVGHRRPASVRAECALALPLTLVWSRSGDRRSQGPGRVENEKPLCAVREQRVVECGCMELYDRGSYSPGGYSVS
jgi:hypothetical protein